MGHQLLLTSSIPHSKYTQTISTLEALTGLRRPQVISTYNILTKPTNVFKPVFEAGKVNQIEQYYMKCSTTWDDDAAKSLDLKAFFSEADDINVDRLFSGKEVKHWTLQISDIPNAGKNPVSAQNFYESTIVHHHSQKSVVSSVAEVKVENASVKAENASVKAENAPEVKAKDEKAPETSVKKETFTDVEMLDSTLWDSGAKTTEDHGFQASDPIEIDADVPPATKTEHLQPNAPEDAMQVDDPGDEKHTTTSKDSFLQFLEDLGYSVINQYWLKGVRFFHGDVVIEIFKLFVTDDAAQAQQTKIKLQALDLSNTFQVRVYISYPKGTSVDVISKGTKTLTDLKATLHNLFELEVPDRMAMDSRVPRP